MDFRVAVVFEVWLASDLEHAVLPFRFENTGTERIQFAQLDEGGEWGVGIQPAAIFLPESSFSVIDKEKSSFELSYLSQKTVRAGEALALSDSCSVKLYINRFASPGDRGQVQIAFTLADSQSGKRRTSFMTITVVLRQPGEPTMKSDFENFPSIPDRQ